MPLIPSSSPTSHITDPTTGEIAKVVTLSDKTQNLDGVNGLVSGSVLFGRLDADNVLPLGIDPTTGTIQTITYEHHEIHSGSHFFVVGYQDLTINQVLDFTWQMPNTKEWIHWDWEIDVESETLWQWYEGAVATNPLANAVTPLNSNRNSGHVSATTMKYEVQTNLAAANSDTDVTGAALMESGIVGSGKKSFGNADRQNELVLKQGHLYCLRATAVAAGYINFNMQWYEHTNKIVDIVSTTTTSTTTTTTTGP